MVNPRLRLAPLAGALALLLHAAVASALTAAEVAIVANRSLPASLDVATRYRQLRGIPQENVVALPLSKRPAISRAEYERSLAEPLRRWLARPEHRGIRCLLLVYGVPFRIQSEYAQTEERKRVEAIDAKLDRLEQEEPDSPEIRRLRRERTRLKRLGRSDLAAVDSELALVRLPHPLRGWLPNPLFRSTPHPPEAVRLPEGGLLTCRLDGPTPELAVALAQRALAAERRPARGRVYLDARGLTRGNYAPFDEAIRRAARLLRARGLSVVLEDTKRLFQPGECPDALLYYGWYRLGHYLDAFDWAPGAVGVHLASSEAVSLRHGPYWCPEMIADGVTATVGPVAEPYASAFPPADLFLSRLVEGEYTLVEDYFLALPHLSWRMVLVG
ncbi:MAG: TIGR03790 family protein, partial [Nitrospirae bacterium]